MNWPTPALSESFHTLGASDPDDLAVLLCAALNIAGVENYILCRIEGRMVVAIEVRRGKRDEGFGGGLVASLPVAPIELGAGNVEILERAIETAGKL